MPNFQTIQLPSVRLSFCLIAAMTAIAMASALVMQYQFDMEPCPLCISQRIGVIVVGILAVIGALVSSSPWGARITSTLGILSAAVGGYISARHVWIQNLPEDEIPICGPGLAYMFETRPVFDALSLLFTGDGHCAEVSATFLGLSIPAWTLVLFVALAIAFVTIIWQTFRASK